MRIYYEDKKVIIMAPRRKRRRMSAVKKPSLPSTVNEYSGLKLSVIDSACKLSGTHSRVCGAKTRKLQKKEMILPEEIEGTLKSIGLHGDKYSKDVQIRGVLKKLKDTKIGTYVMCCVCKEWFFLSDIKDVQQIPGKNVMPLNSTQLVIIYENKVIDQNLIFVYLFFFCFILDFVTCSSPILKRQVKIVFRIFITALIYTL